MTALLALAILAALLADLLRVMLHRDRARQRVLILGVGPLARATGKNLARQAHAPQVVGHVVLPGERASASVAPILGKFSDLPRILHQIAVDAIYVGVQRPASNVHRAVRFCETIGIPFYVPLPTLGLSRARVAGAGSTDHPGYVEYVNVERKPIQRILKRGMDVALSMVALSALAPVLVAIAALVKLTSPGPVLFLQERHGLFGQRFAMFKFRTMVAGAEGLRNGLEAGNGRDGPAFKLKNDPRVTPIGRILRRYNIDELPQLINILKGDMSIVGPRPPLPREVERYEAWHLRRLSVRPGLTCYWQVADRARVRFRDWMLLDLRYIDHWNLLTDLRLILRTVPAVVAGKGDE